LLFEVHETEAFQVWIGGLKDEVSRAIILRRIRRLGGGHLGDVKAVGAGVHELRIAYGPGFRVYFVRRGEVVILLLCGGDKGSQARDIERARRMALEV